MYINYEYTQSNEFVMVEPLYYDGSTVVMTVLLFHNPVGILCDETFPIGGLCFPEHHFVL